MKTILKFRYEIHHFEILGASKRWYELSFTTGRTLAQKLGYDFGSVMEVEVSTTRFPSSCKLVYAGHMGGMRVYTLSPTGIAVIFCEEKTVKALGFDPHKKNLYFRRVK